MIMKLGLTDSIETNICGIDITLNRITEKFREAMAAIEKRYPEPRTKDVEEFRENEMLDVWADYCIRSFKPFDYNGKQVEYSEKNARILIRGELIERGIVSFCLDNTNFATEANLKFDFTKKK